MITMDFKPRGLKNSTGVCYSNAVLQSLTTLAKSSYFLLELQALRYQYRKFDTDESVCYTSTTRTELSHTSPFIDLLVVLEEMSKSSVYGIINPYCFQSSLASRGKENGTKFTSNEGAYPFEWLCFLLESLYEAPNLKGGTKALQLVLDRLFGINSAYECRCNTCGQEQVRQSIPGVTKWGLTLDPVGKPDPPKGSDLPIALQHLVDRLKWQTQVVYRKCYKCQRNTRVECSWQGLTNPPEFLVFDIKTYEKIAIRKGQKEGYKFLFSRIYPDNVICVRGSNTMATKSYLLQAVVKLEGKGHEHAVAFVRSGRY